MAFITRVANYKFGLRQSTAAKNEAMSHAAAVIKQRRFYRKYCSGRLIVTYILYTFRNTTLSEDKTIKYKMWKKNAIKTEKNKKIWKFKNHFHDLRNKQNTLDFFQTNNFSFPFLWAKAYNKPEDGNYKDEV